MISGKLSFVCDDSSSQSPVHGVYTEERFVVSIQEWDSFDDCCCCQLHARRARHCSEEGRLRRASLLLSDFGLNCLLVSALVSFSQFEVRIVGISLVLLVLIEKGN